MFGIVKLAALSAALAGTLVTAAERDQPASPISSLEASSRARGASSSGLRAGLLSGRDLSGASLAETHEAMVVMLQLSEATPAR